MRVNSILVDDLGCRRYQGTPGRTGVRTWCRATHIYLLRAACLTDPALWDRSHTVLAFRAGVHRAPRASGPQRLQGVG
jgi:hypothetical protein